MVALVLLLLVVALAFGLYRLLAATRDSRTLWLSSIAIGSSLGITRAVLGCVGWYIVEHTGSAIQVPAFALAMLTWPEAMVFGRLRGPAPLQFYVQLGSLLVMTSLMMVCGVDLLVHDSRRQTGER